VSAEFVWRMEDVLELYAEAFNEQQPVVCFDERPCVLHSDTHPSLPAQPGRAGRYDYEYQRNGACNLFMMFQPGAGWRHAKVTDQRTKADFAACMRELVDVHFPHAEKIRVVMDNLNTHTPASLYSAFPPAEARRVLSKLEFHYTPKHASWLNMVEIELSVLVHQCLKRRIPDLLTLTCEVAAWQAARNAQSATVRWQFDVAQARSKLVRLYPELLS
jgi:DDE superfamily endonuclease